jgi:hypothetical protein
MKPCWAWAGWEPDRHYRRIGRSGTSYFGRGAWLDEWRNRLEHPDTLRPLADAGVTALVTWCYKGFGLEIESQQWPRLRKFIQTAHDLNLQVYGYTQGASLYMETLLAEQPAAAQWAARKFTGETATWGGQYYRVIPCLGNPDYLAYMERVIEQALQLGLDGIHMDNSYYLHCWCRRCQSDFRNWLNDFPDLDQRAGLPTADHVSAPPLPREQEVFSDPLQQLWMEFGVQRRLAALKRFRDRIKQTRPDALYIGNPAFPRRPGFKAQLSFDPSREGQVFDVLFAENGNLPGMAAGQYVSQALAYSYAQAGGYRVLSSAWQKGPFGHSPAATPAQLWTQLAEEFSYDAAWLGNNWALRAAGDRDRLLMDDNPLFPAFTQAMRFFRSLEQSLPLDRRTPWSELAVLLAPDTLTLAAATDAAPFAALLQELLAQHLPFQFLYPGQPLPPQTRALLVWQQSCLSDAALKQISDFAQQPGRCALIAGDSGRLDESAIPRNASQWRAWLDHPRMHHAPLNPADAPTITQSHQHLGRDDIRPSSAARQTLWALMAHWQPTLRIDAPSRVLIHAEQADDRRFIHLRDQSASNEPVTGCRIHLPPAASKIRFHHPAHPHPTPLSPDQPLPPFTHYALVEFSIATT